MKKIILSLLITVTVIGLGLGMTACNRATPQGQLADLLYTHNHEKFEYDIKIYDVKNDRYDSERGTYTAELDRFAKGSEVAFGSRMLHDVREGIRVTGKLVYGKTEYRMGCYYRLSSDTNYMVPSYSFLTVVENGVTTYEMQGNYNGNTFECERRFTDSTPQNGSLKLSGTVWDNNQFQQILRALPGTTFSGGMSISFNTPIANAHEFAVATLSAKGSSTASVKTPYTDTVEAFRENGISCYKISLSRATEVNGLSHTLYYSVDEIKLKGIGMKNVLVKIVEPYYDSARQPFETHYELVGIECGNTAR